MVRRSTSTYAEAVSSGEPYCSIACASASCSESSGCFSRKLSRAAWRCSSASVSASWTVAASLPLSLDFKASRYSSIDLIMSASFYRAIYERFHLFPDTLPDHESFPSFRCDLVIPTRRTRDRGLHHTRQQPIIFQRVKDRIERA